MDKKRAEGQLDMHRLFEGKLKVSKQEAKIAAANSIEMYGNVMLSKGLKARAQEVVYNR